MMGLLGNVAEVEELRPQLMTSEFITVFSDLLYSTSDGIEVRVLRYKTDYETRLIKSNPL